MDIIQYVDRAYQDYPRHKINRIWLSFVGCLNGLMDCHGDNKYEVPHMGKGRLEWENGLPVTIEATNDHMIELGLHAD